MAPTNRVEIWVPCTVITAPARKFDPETVIGVSGSPTLADPGVNPVIVGLVLTTLTLKLADPPPGVAFEIKPLRVVGFCVSVALSLNEMALLLEIMPWPLPNVAVVDPIKPVPATTIVTAPDPASI